MLIEIARKQIQFRSPRRPHEIQAWLERNIGAVFHPLAGDPPVSFEAAYQWAGLKFQVRLVYEAAFAAEDAYSFHLDCQAESMPKDLPALQRSADSWFKLWTREWKPDSGKNSFRSDEGLYQSRVAEWRKTHDSLQDPEALQGLILEAMKAGATFSTASKEGGTIIGFRENRWFRSEYGESDDYDIYRTPEEFLRFLRQYYDFETSRTIWPNKATEPVVWRLIYRQLHYASA